MSGRGLPALGAPRRNSGCVITVEAGEAPCLWPVNGLCPRAASIRCDQEWGPLDTKLWVGYVFYLRYPMSFRGQDSRW
jgi:hypothetical protein